MTLGALVTKDLRIEFRGRDALAAGLTVSLLIALVGNIAFSERTDAARALGGVLWMAIVFGAQVGLARSFVLERERGTYHGLIASPTSSFSIWGAKLIVHTLVLVVLGVATLLALVLFFRTVTIPIGLPIMLVFLLGVLGIALVNTTTATLAMHGANWILLVPLLSLPLLFPVLASTIPATDLVLQGAPLESVLPHVRVLVAFDIVMLTAAWLLVPYVLEP